MQDNSARTIEPRIVSGLRCPFADAVARAAPRAFRLRPSAFRVVRLPPGPASSPSRLAVGVRRRCRWRCTHMQPPAVVRHARQRERRGAAVRRVPPRVQASASTAPLRPRLPRCAAHLTSLSRTTKRNHTAAPRHGRDSSDVRAFYIRLRVSTLHAHGCKVRPHESSHGSAQARPLHSTTTTAPHILAPSSHVCDDTGRIVTRHVIRAQTTDCVTHMHHTNKHVTASKGICDTRQPTPAHTWPHAHNSTSSKTTTHAPLTMHPTT